MKLNVVVLIIFCILLLSPNVLAISKNQMLEITKIEDALFGYDYSNDKVEDRISRLEQNIYGKTNNGLIDNRLKKYLRI